MVGVATWRLEIRLEPGFFCLTLEGGIGGERDWRGRSTGKGVETEGDKGRKRQMEGKEWAAAGGNGNTSREKEI